MAFRDLNWFWRPWFFWSLFAVWFCIGIGYIVFFFHPSMTTDWFAHYLGITALFAVIILPLGWIVFKKQRIEIKRKEKNKKEM